MTAFPQRQVAVHAAGSLKGEGRRHVRLGDAEPVGRRLQRKGHGRILDRFPAVDVPYFQGVLDVRGEADRKVGRVRLE